MEEESIRDNFVIIYELMDELMDFGYPQTTDSKILQEYVPLFASQYFNVPESQIVFFKSQLLTIYKRETFRLFSFSVLISVFTFLLPRYITQEGHKLDTGAPRPPATVTNAVSWRSEGIKYRKNEVFLDVIESVNLLVGTLLDARNFLRILVEVFKYFLLVCYNTASCWLLDFVVTLFMVFFYISKLMCKIKV